MEYLARAQTDAELDEAFDKVFEYILEDRGKRPEDTAKLIMRGLHSPAPVVGEPTNTLSLLTWVQDPKNLQRLHLDMIMSIIRLTYFLPPHNLESRQTWNRALKAVREELARRGEDTETLLFGLVEHRET